MPKRLTPKQAKLVCKEITQHIGGQTNGTYVDGVWTPTTSVWDENPVKWWSNIFSNGQLTNDFFEGLLNVNVEQRVRAFDMENPFEKYFQQGEQYGFGNMEFYVNPQESRYFAINPEQTKNGTYYYQGENYETRISGLGSNSVSLTTTIHDGVGESNQSISENYHCLLDKVPDIKQIFFRPNFQRQYQATYTQEMLSQVSTTWGTVGTFIDGISTTLNAEKKREEKRQIVSTFKDGIDRGWIPLIPVSDTTTADGAQNLLMQIRTIEDNFTNDSSNYNMWSAVNIDNPIITASEKSNIDIIIRNDIKNLMDVKGLAAAFNMDKADYTADGFGQNVIGIDVFRSAPDGTGVYDANAAEDRSILAVLFDSFALHADRKFDQTSQMYLKNMAKEQFFRNVIDEIALNPFANCVGFTTSTFTVVTGDSAPADWATSTAKYYRKTGSGVYVPVTSALSGITTQYESGKYYVRA